MDTAVTRHEIYPCGSQSVTLGGIQYTGQRCGPDSSSRYQFNIGGGCVDSANNPVQLNNWGSLGGGTQQISSAGVRTDTVTGTAMVNGVSTAVTCKNVYAVTNSSNVADSNPANNFNWGTITPIPANTLCSSGSLDALEQVRCYSQYYYESGLSNESSTCSPRIETDWTATTAANFIDVNFRPNSLVFMDEYKPNPSGDGGSMLTRQEQWRGVQVSSNNWVNCRVIETGALSLKKISSSKLLATYQESTITTSTMKSACVAEFSGKRRSFMFYLNL